MTRRREPAHVDADLGDDHLGGAFPDPRDRQREGGGLIERGHQLVHRGIELDDHRGEVIDVAQMQTQHHAVMVGQPSTGS
jgi:hypothetical protein